MTRSARSGQVCRLTAADLPPDIPLSAHHLCPLLSSCHSSPVPAFLVSRCPLALTAADQLRAQVVAAVSWFHPPSWCLCVCLCLSACVRALMPYTTPSPWWLLCLQWSVDPPLGGKTRFVILYVHRSIYRHRGKVTPTSTRSLDVRTSIDIDRYKIDIAASLRTCGGPVWSTVEEMSTSSFLAAQPM